MSYRLNGELNHENTITPQQISDSSIPNGLCNDRFYMDSASELFLINNK